MCRGGASHRGVPSVVRHRVGDVVCGDGGGESRHRVMDHASDAAHDDCGDGGDDDDPHSVVVTSLQRQSPEYCCRRRELQ